MRRVFLFFLVLFTAIFLGAFVLIHCIDLTVLNKDYVIAKMEEHQLYDKLIDSMGESSQGAGIEAKAFVEIIGMDTIKSIVDSIVISVLSYLKDPSVQTIEIGLPEGILPSDSMISAESLLGEEEMDALHQAKWMVQTMLVARTAALLLSIASIAIIIIIAKGICSKMRWVGYSFLSTGILVIVLSLLVQGLFVPAMDSGLSEIGSSVIVILPLLKSLVWDYSSLVQFSGLVLFFAGVLIVLVSILLFSQFFKSAREKFLKEKSEIVEKRGELEAREKGIR